MRTRVGWERWRAFPAGRAQGCRGAGNNEYAHNERLNVPHSTRHAETGLRRLFAAGQGVALREESQYARPVNVERPPHRCGVTSALSGPVSLQIPYFNAGVFLENKTQIGKVEEIFGKIHEVVRLSCRSCRCPPGHRASAEKMLPGSSSDPLCANRLLDIHRQKAVSRDAP